MVAKNYLNGQSGVRMAREDEKVKIFSTERRTEDKMEKEMSQIKYR